MLLGSACLKGMLRRMELRHLRYFVAVAEEENITRAAARLRVSQPPLSRQIRDLEEQLGIELLARSAHSVRLTEAGKVFLGEARAVLARAEQAVDAARAVAGGTRGDLDVGYAPSLTVDLLPRALQNFHHASPAARVRLHDLSTEEMLSGIRDGSLQVALLIRPAAGNLRGMKFEDLREYPVCVAMSPAHPLANRRVVPLDCLRQERLIGYDRAGYPEYHVWLQTVFGGEAPALAEEHDSVTSLIAAVESGRGAALVSKSLACFSGPRLKLRPLRPAIPAMCIGAVTLATNSDALTQGVLAAAKAATPSRRETRSRPSH